MSEVIAQGIVQENNVILYGPETGLIYKVFGVISWVGRGTGAVARWFLSPREILDRSGRNTCLCRRVRTMC
jgi:hypothetical protein